MAELLIIEDDEATRSFFARALEHLGTIDHAARLDEALKAIDAKKYDLIVLDVNLRGHDGLRVLDRVRAGQHNATTPVFVVSSDPAVGARLSGKPASFFVPKPVRLPVLVTLIAGVLKVDPRRGAAGASPSGVRAVGGSSASGLRPSSAVPQSSASGVRGSAASGVRPAPGAGAPIPAEGDVAKEQPRERGLLSSLSGLFRNPTK